LTGNETADRWAAHDVIAGVFGGGGAGAVAGLFLAVRGLDFEAGWGLLGGAVVGSLVGILLLTSSHRESKGFLTVTVFVMWILALASGAFLYFLYDAIQNFQ
jgi:hypothetical protein